jgi:hypothetical protein
MKEEWEKYLEAHRITDVLEQSIGAALLDNSRDLISVLADEIEATASGNTTSIRTPQALPEHLMDGAQARMDREELEIVVGKALSRLLVNMPVKPMAHLAENLRQARCSSCTISTTSFEIAEVEENGKNNRPRKTGAQRGVRAGETRETTGGNNGAAAAKRGGIDRGELKDEEKLLFRVSECPIFFETEISERNSTYTIHLRIATILAIALHRSKV